MKRNLRVVQDHCKDLLWRRGLCGWCTVIWGICTCLATSSLSSAQDIETISIAQPRPDWINNLDNLDTIHGDPYFVVMTAQYPTRVEARRSLEAAIRDRVAEYLEFSLPDNAAAAEWFDAAYVQAEVIGKGYKLIVQEPVDPELFEHVVELTPDLKFAYRGYARLELSEKLLNHVQQACREKQMLQRVKRWGTGYLAIVGGLAIVFCYLRMESLTRHHYSYRIQFLALVMAAIWAVAIVRLSYL